MRTTKVYPYKRWDHMAGGHRQIKERLATLEKIEELRAELASATGQEVDSERIFDGWHVPREYKGNLLHVLKGTDGNGYVIHIYGSDGSPPRLTMKFSDAASAFEEACTIIDHGSGR
jgi:hypothetical protein